MDPPMVEKGRKRSRVSLLEPAWSPIGLVLCLKQALLVIQQGHQNGPLTPDCMVSKLMVLGDRKCVAPPNLAGMGLLGPHRECQEEENEK